MSQFIEYANYDALGLTELVQSGEVTVKDILDASLARIAEFNPQLNAMVNMFEDAATEYARSESSAPLYGVPVAVKDCVAGLKGVPQRFGTRLTQNYIPDRDEEIIRRYREAGVIFVGQTNVPEFSSSITTESVLYGPCNNPWDLTRTVGGSSGGSACAVAAGLVPVATANDSAGSIRIPASCTGVFGFKPSRGRTPNGPDVSEIWNGLFVQHVITRSVRDSAAFLDIAQGIDAGAPYTAPTLNGSYLDETKKDVERLKIGFNVNAMNDVSVDKACKQAVLQTAHLLEDLGHDVVEVQPDLDLKTLFPVIENLLAVNLAYEMQNFADLQQVELSPDTVENCHFQMAERGKQLPALAMMEFFSLKAACERGMGRFFKSYDAYLTPTLATEPIVHGYINANGSDLREYLDRFWAFSPFTVLANIAGLPSMSVPLTMSEGGLPIGSMVTAAYGQDDKLFRLAAQFEKAKPWITKRPNLNKLRNAN